MAVPDPGFGEELSGSRPDLRDYVETDSPAAGHDKMFRTLYRELVRCNKSLFQKALGPNEMNEFSKLLDLLIRLETE